MKILLADDDLDDLFFFKKALSEIPIETELTTDHDGEELMAYLTENSDHLPDVLFLDLSMPRKTGFECLSEIKLNDKFKVLPVIMFSTFYKKDINFEKGMKNMLYQIGAMDYICKPDDFEKLKQVIHAALISIIEKKCNTL